MWNSDWQLECTKFFLFSFTCYLLDGNQWLSALQCGRRSSGLMKGFLRRWERRTGGVYGRDLVSFHCCPGLSHTLTFVCAVSCNLWHDELPAACCMPCGSVAWELLKCQSAASFLCYSYTSSPNPTLISQFASFRSWADYHSPSLHYVPHAQTIYLGNRGTRPQAGCSTFSLFLCPLASSSPPLIGSRWCPEGLWISAPTSS